MSSRTLPFGEPGAVILGTGRYAPDRVLSNFDLEKRVETSDAWIRERTGIRERRIAADGEDASDMAVAASRCALEAASLAPTDLDMVLVATVSGDELMPATAVHVQRKLGCRDVPAFDVSAACAGFLYALTIADAMVRSQHARHVLICGVELLSRLLDWEDRTTCVLFGDGAGAAIVGPRSADEGATSSGIVVTRLHADGALAHALHVPAGGTRIPLTHEGLARRENKVHMVGAEVFKAAVRCLAAACREALDAARLGPADVDWVVAHQANLRILTQVAVRLDIPLDRFVLNIERYGNTSSASVPMALDEAIRDGRIRKGQTVLMCALGAGIAWGSAVVRI